MDVQERRGDYAMCCVELQRPLDLSLYSDAKAMVTVGKPEPEIQVKLEEGSHHVRIVDAAIDTDTKRFEPWAFREAERGLRPTRVCLAAVGSEPATDTVRLHSISLDGCR
jgi:hypothetical protein